MLCFMLSALMLFSLIPTVYAADVVGSKMQPGTGDVPVELTQEASNFSVTVPTVLPVDVDSNGVITVSTDNRIINNSWGPILVEGLSVIPLDEWELVDFTTDFSQESVGTTLFGFQMNGANVPVDGVCDVSVFPSIEGKSELSFTYDAHVATQKVSLEDVQIANVVFIIGWDNTPIYYQIVSLPDIIDDNGIAQMNIGEAVDLEAVAVYSSDKKEWVSSNTSVITVDQEGFVTAIAPGTATITYTNARNGASGSLSFNVKSPLSSISLNKSSASISKGSTTSLSVTYNPSNTTDSKTVTWSSSNTSVATVSSSGVVTGKGAGTATITANVNGKTARCTVTVTVTTITFYHRKGYTNGKTLTAESGMTFSEFCKSSYNTLGWYCSGNKVLVKKYGDVYSIYYGSSDVTPNTVIVAGRDYLSKYYSD